MSIKVKKLRENAKLPSRGSSFAAGYDLYAAIDEDIEIYPSDSKLIGTGLAMEIPVLTFGGIFARSGLALKESLRPANCVGVIDSDYRGEIMVAIHNDGDVIRVIHPQERIAQLIILPYIDVNYEETEEELTFTARGEGGFGSTGK